MPLSEDERRRKNREKQAAYRARQRALKVEQANAVEVTLVTAADAPMTMRSSVERAVSAAKWLTDSDDAAVTLARRLAEHIDVLEARGDIKGALSAHGRLSRALGDLGLTPVVREQRELRSRKLEAREEVERLDQNEGKPLPEGVVPIKRPPRRKPA